MKRPNKQQEIDSESSGSNTIQKTKPACIVEAHEFARKRLEKTLPKDREDSIAEKGVQKMSHETLVRKFVPMLQALNIQDANWALDKERDKLEKLASWHLTKVMSKKRGCSGSTLRAKNSPFCYADGHLSSQKCGVGTEVSK